MLIKIFGFFDLLSAALVLMLKFGMIPWNVVVGAVIYLGMKAYLFKGSIMSLLDGACAIYIILMLFGIDTFLTYLIIIYLAQKGLASFL